MSAHKSDTLVNTPKITFGMIVLNGEPFIKYNLRALYPYAHQIIVVEGACPSSASVATSLLRMGENGGSPPRLRSAFSLLTSGLDVRLPTSWYIDQLGLKLQPWKTGSGRPIG